MSNYFKLKKRLKFTSHGEKLLEIKREQLLQLLRSAKRRYAAVKEEMITAVGKAFELLNQTYMFEGKENTKLIADVLKKNPIFKVVLVYSSKLGLDIPSLNVQVQSKKKLPPYSFQGTTLYLDMAISAFEDAFQKIINYAEIESTLFSYAWEYRKIYRRIKALDDIIIPRIENQFRTIEQTLEDLEREEFIRMREIKNHLESKNENEELPEDGN